MRNVNEPRRIGRDLVRWTAIVFGVAGAAAAWGWQWALLALVATPVAMIAGFFLLLLIAAVVS
jgi:hypothetical protein